MNLYRVLKGDVAHYVQPEQIEYYADNGYEIYRVVEERVTDLAGETKRAKVDSTTVISGGDER